VGEAEFGLIDGVIETRPGMLDGGEVVEVSFDPKRLSFEELLTHAEENNCASKVITRTDGQLEIARAKIGARASRSDETIDVDQNVKYYLSKSALSVLPMTELQAARVNATLEPGTWRRWLSPRQLALLSRVEERRKADPKWSAPSAIGKPLIESWATLESALGD
jgi:hypothetical protein